MAIATGLLVGRQFEARATAYDDVIEGGLDLSPGIATETIPGMEAPEGSTAWDSSEGGQLYDGTADEGMPIDDGHGHPAGCRSGGDCDSCDPPYGMVNRLIDNKQACWTLRTEALLLWREAPRYRQLDDFIPIGTGLPNANQLNSPGAAGPRFSLFRTDGCGDALEVTYFRVANWNAVNVASDGGTGTYRTNLGAAAQSFELNGRTTVHPNIQLLGGFRWFQWQENISSVYNAGQATPASVSVGTINDLYGYQIGFDSLLLSTRWFRVEALMKGGAYYNRNRMTASSAGLGSSWSPTVGADSAAFVGELGMTGVMPVTRNIDFRIGYLAFWLQGLAQPTNQFRTGQGFDPTAPVVVDTTGSTVLQGLTLGLEGRW